MFDEAISRIAKILVSNNIKHEPIHFLHKSNNLLFGDNVNVFIKVALGTPETNGNLETELLFYTNYSEKLNLMSPLIPTVELLNIGNEPYQFIVMPWRNFILIEDTKNLELNHIEELMIQLNHIHQLPILGGFIVNSAEKLHQRFDYRLALSNKFHPSQYHVDIAKELVNAFFVDEPFNRSKGVIVHGDSHTGNIVKDIENGKYLWVDFESSLVAPREWDIGTLKLNFLHIHQEQNIWEGSLKVLELNGSIDYELVESFLIIKAILATTFRMSLPDRQELFQKQVEALKPLLDGKPFPRLFF